MTDYFEAPDGHGEPTIWVKGEFHDMPLIHRCEVGPTDWPDVVARMTGTTITTDDATVALISTVLSDYYTWDGSREEAAELFAPEARAILAALTGVPHD